VAISSLAFFVGAYRLTGVVLTPAALRYGRQRLPPIDRTADAIHQSAQCRVAAALQDREKATTFCSTIGQRAFSIGVANARLGARWITRFNPSERNSSRDGGAVFPGPAAGSESCCALRVAAAIAASAGGE